MKVVRFKINRPSARVDILTGNGQLQQISHNAMQALIPVIEAQFFQEFGVAGKFTLDEYVTDRYTVKISADSAQTATVLKQHPRWLSQFTDNMKI